MIGPDETMLREVQGYHGDTSRMFYVGSVSERARKLCEVTQQAMEAGIRQCGPGVPVKSIGKVRAGFWCHATLCTSPTRDSPQCNRDQPLQHARQPYVTENLARSSKMSMCAFPGLVPCVEGDMCLHAQAIHEVAERHGYGVVREFVGHGVGRVFHAAPHVMHCRNGEPGIMQVCP